MSDNTYDYEDFPDPEDYENYEDYEDDSEEDTGEIETYEEDSEGYEDDFELAELNLPTCVQASWNMIKLFGDTEKRKKIANIILSDILGKGRIKGDIAKTGLLCITRFPDGIRSELLEIAPYINNIQTEITDDEVLGYMEAFSYGCCAFVYDHIAKYVKDKGLNSEDLISIYRGNRDAEDIPYLGYNYTMDTGADTFLSASFRPTDSLTLTLASLTAVLDIIQEGKLKVSEHKDTPAEEEKSIKREDKLYDGIIRDTVADILKIYDCIYADCFVEIPKGVLTSEGILCYTEGRYKVDKDTGYYAVRFYETVCQSLNLGKDSYIGAVPDTADEFLKHPSYPLFHLYNIMGVSGGRKFNSWVEFKMGVMSTDSDLTPEQRQELQDKGFASTLTKVVTNLFDTYTKDDYIGLKTAITHRLTTVVIVNEFKVNGMMSFTYHHTGSKNEPIFGRCVLPRINSIIGKSTGELVAEPNLTNDCYKFLYVGDGEAYNNEILFAYKAYENMIASGTPVNSKNIILGKNMSNGMPYTANLQSPQEIFTTILAGSGSGKGVLTLSLLAGLFAAGHPVGYVDYKPDMSAMLWNMERKIGRADCRLLAVDGLANQDKYGTRPVRDYNYGTGGDVIAENGVLHQKLHLLPYLKTMQLSFALAGLRAKGCKDFGKNKIFFVLDEAQQANTAYEEWCNQLNAYKAPKQKAGQESTESDYDRVMQRMKTVFVDDLASSIRDVGNTTGRVGQVGYIVIGQATDPAAWKSNAGDWKYNLFGFPIGSTTLKLMGRGVGEGSMYGLPKVRYAGKEMMGSLGYWTVSRTSKSGNDTSPVGIKSYLVLNENDYDPNNQNNGGFAASLLANITDATTANNITQNEFTMGDGVTIRESVGFYGLMKMLCPDEDTLVSTMSSAYNCVEKILVGSGILANLGYTTVEEYLYSADPASFFTVKEIMDSYNAGGITKEEAELNTGETESGTYSGFGGASSFTPEDSSNTQERQGYVDDYNDDEVGYSSDSQEPMDLFGDDTTPEQNDPFRQSEPIRQGSPFNTGVGNAGVGNTTTGTPIGRQQPIFSEPTRSVNNHTVYNDAYTESINVKDSPFTYAGGKMSSAYAFKQISGMILDEITKAYGSLDRIYSVDIANSGLMVINNVKFMPQFNTEFIESLPVDIKGAVSSGAIAELFYFDNLYKFSNLQHLSIESTRLAETRVRQEMGIRRNQGWDKLFDKIPSLQELYIAGNAIHNGEEARVYEENGRAGFGVKEKLMSEWNMPDLSNSWVGRVWHSKPAGWVKKGAGYTLGIKGLLTVASILGPWGVVFGAITAGAWYMDKKNKSN